ncbi:hypothetical protein D3C73_955500 [compost metagenome]
MEAVEELAAAAFPALYFGAGLRVEVFFRELAAFAALGWRLLPAHRQARLAGGRQLDQPARGTGSVLLQIVLCHAQARFGTHRTRGNFRLHPVAGFILEIGKRTGQENGEQQPAEDETGPGVQPGHRLTKALFHVRSIQYASPDTAARIRHGTASPSQARSAVRQAKHQITAPR